MALKQVTGHQASPNASEKQIRRCKTCQPQEPTTPQTSTPPETTSSPQIRMEAPTNTDCPPHPTNQNFRNRHQLLPNPGELHPDQAVTNISLRLATFSADNHPRGSTHRTSTAPGQSSTKGTTQLASPHLKSKDPSKISLRGLAHKLPCNCLKKFV